MRRICPNFELFYRLQETFWEGLARIPFHMDTNAHLTLHPSEHSAEVVPLRLKRECELEEAQFIALFSTKDPQRAEDVIFSALEEMAAQVEEIRLSVAQNGIEATLISARRLTVISQGVGLLSVSRAASFFRPANAKASTATISAAFERLDRSFDEAVSQVWKMFEAL